jgi:hypothetical protein
MVLVEESFEKSGGEHIGEIFLYPCAPSFDLLKNILKFLPGLLKDVLNLGFPA